MRRAKSFDQKFKKWARKEKSRRSVINLVTIRVYYFLTLYYITWTELKRQTKTENRVSNVATFFLWYRARVYRRTRGREISLPPETDYKILLLLRPWKRALARN